MKPSKRERAAAQSASNRAETDEDRERRRLEKRIDDLDRLIISAMARPRNRNVALILDSLMVHREEIRQQIQPAASNPLNTARN